MEESRMVTGNPLAHDEMAVEPSLLVGGDWRSADATIDVANPARNEIFARVSRGRVEDAGGTGTDLPLAAGGGDGYHWGDAPNDRAGIEPTTFTLPLPRGSLHEGANTVTVTSMAGSWLIYDAFGLEEPAS
jgi:hypothetical protein